MRREGNQRAYHKLLNLEALVLVCGGSKTKIIK